MTESTRIEWADHTFSPWLGCTPVSAACDHCYAADMARRYGWPAYQAGVPRRLTAPSTWKMPRRWNKRARANGVRFKVFPSLCDPFDSEAPDRWRADLVKLIDDTPDLDWLLLTKRPHLAGKWVDRQGPLPRNVWLGVTAETQAMADLRIPQLLAIDDPTPRVRFVSIEPMLGPVDLTASPDWFQGEPGWGQAIGWVIAGGESGTSARPSHPAWFRALRDQCVAAGVPFFLKQWGAWAPIETFDRLELEPGAAVSAPGQMYRVGKKAAGATLDGREWRQVPGQP